MSREQVTEFFNIVNEYDDFEYLLYIIICNCGPTLKKQKIASLVTFSNDKRKLNLIWNKYKDRLRKELGVSFFELRKDKRNIVVLFYNYEMLKIHIKDKQSMAFLNRFGYKSEMNVNQCLCHLKRRFEKICPHEIGVFLGYPIEDVISFMDCTHTKCKMVGYWKVYHNVERAKVIFNKYDSIKESIIELILKGYKPTELMSLC